ncbi:MAG: family Rossman fold protein [Rhodospirillales bacterium]|nr:family Rossman fold protein [Rhodospirillales bacterium]
MATVKRLCVYCGSAEGRLPSYRASAEQLGRALAAAGIELVYGGGRIGLMGRVADTVLTGGGRVTGIIPAHLHDREVGHHGVSELQVVGSMHERKQRMFEMSDAFAVLPGGLGTLDEFFEIITWKQLSLHDKPVVVLNVAGYWQKLIALIDHAIDSGFAPPRARGFFTVVDSVEALMQSLAASHEPERPAEPRLI